MERNELLHSAFHTLQEVSEIRNHHKVVYQERPCMIMYSFLFNCFVTQQQTDLISLEKSQTLQTQVMQDLST
jgi:hypothetical protein